MRLFDLTMALLFAFAAAVQFNDPDPIPWVAIYTAAAVVSLIAASGRRVPLGVSAAVALVAIGWAAFIGFGGPAISDYRHMFDSWEMKSSSVEEAREASGLLIIAGWMTVLFVRGLRRSPTRA